MTTPKPVEVEEPPLDVPWGLTIVIALGAAAIVVLLVLFAQRWISNLWFGYGWSSDKGNGPEGLQQTVLYAAIALLFVPVVRRFLRREFRKVHTRIERGHDEVHEHLQHLHDQLGLDRYERKP